MQVDLSRVWLSFSSIIVASSFIFSKAISDIFLSVIFLFVVHPYDVGDGIMIGPDLHYVSCASLLAQQHSCELQSIISDWNPLLAYSCKDLLERRIG